MMPSMTTAESRGYQQICGRDGAMMVVAADQRGGMRKIMAAHPSEEAAITEAMLGETKADIATYLASAAGCILLDPVCAVPGIVDQKVLPRDTALLIGLDASGFDTTPEGYQVSKLVPGVDARKVRALGGTGGKIMVYLRSDRPDANEANVEILRRCGEDFAREDLLLVVEFLTYSLPNEGKEDYRAAFPGLIEGARASASRSARKSSSSPIPATRGPAHASPPSAEAFPGRSCPPASTTRPSWARSISPWRMVPRASSPAVRSGRTASRSTAT